MSLTLEQRKAAALGGTLAHEIARMDKERSSLRPAMFETDHMGKQVQELVEASAYAQVAKELEALQSPAILAFQQYQELLGRSSAIGFAFEAWQDSERTYLAKMRNMFDPMVDIRKSVLADSSMQRLIKQLTEGSSVSDYAKSIAERSLGIESVTQMLAQNVEESRHQTKKLYEDLGVSRSIQGYLKDFERIRQRD